jgi:hypothetical protein
VLPERINQPTLMLISFCLYRTGRKMMCDSAQADAAQTENVSLYFRQTRYILALSRSTLLGKTLSQISGILRCRHGVAQTSSILCLSRDRP